MHIKSAEFIKGVVGEDEILHDGRKQFALIGRSNVGKSSLINSLTASKGLARTSSSPGRTQQLNFFIIDDSFYLVDLPGYAYAKLPKKEREKLQILINWYLFLSNVEQEKIFLIIDAKVGPTKDDLEILTALEQHQKKVIIIANKIDKIRPSQYRNQMSKITDIIGSHYIIPYSSKDSRGKKEVLAELY